MSKPSKADLELIPMSKRCPECYHWPYNPKVGHNKILGCTATGQRTDNKSVAVNINLNLLYHILESSTVQ